MLFATLRDYAGARTIELDVPSGTTVLSMKKALVKEYPKMAPAQNSILTAIDREYASDEQVIPLEAEIALFPPVSGG